MNSLESCALFKELRPDTLEALKELAEERTYPEGALIFEEGDPGDGLYVVTEGEIEISASLEGGAQRPISRLGAGEPFGEMAFIETKPRSATARATTPTRLSFLPTAAFNTVLEKNPALASALLKQISRRLRDFTQHYIRETLQTERLTLVGRFTGSIIHDLKNPLNVISVSAELLGAEDTDAELRRESSRRISRQVERITDMVSEVLEFTRNEEQTFVPMCMRYAQFLEHVLEEERPVLASRGVRIEVQGKIPEDEVLLNPKRFQRVFVNLLNNAAEAMGKKGIIQLRCHADNRGVTCEVEDSGPGIAPEVAETLFDPFVTHGKPQGTGLGLAIAKKIVENHRGKISVGTGSKGGAVFTLWLPKPGEA